VVWVSRPHPVLRQCCKRRNTSKSRRRNQCKPKSARTQQSSQKASPHCSQTMPSSGTKRGVLSAPPGTARASSARYWSLPAASSPATSTVGMKSGIALQKRSHRKAADQLARGHRISARDSFLRAATYYCASEFFLHGSPRDPRITSAYQKSVECYRGSAKLFDPPIEPVEIPYENTTLPGYFHRVDHSDRKRPLLIIHSGFDGGSAQEVHDSGARAAVERGYNVLASTGRDNSAPCIGRA